MKLKFKKRRKIFTALEISDNWLKIVQAIPAAKDKKLKRVLVEKITSLDDQQISEKIKELSKKIDINPDLLTVVVPHQLAAVRNIELPSTNPNEIKDMVDLQIGKQTPFSKEEIIYDYDILTANTEGYSKVMLTIVRENVVARYFKILGQIQMKTEKVALSSEGLLTWCRFACKGMPEDKSYAVVDVGYDTSDFAVVSKDKLIFCRNLSVGFSQSQNRLNEWQEKFIEEINLCIYAYQNEVMDKDIAKIIISGAEMVTQDLNETVFKEKIGAPVEIITELKNIPEAIDAPADKKIEGRNVSFCSLMGIVLNFPEQKINLIPPQLKIEKGVRERGKDLYLFGIFLVFILVTISSIFFGRMYNNEQYLKALKKEILKIQNKVDKLHGMMEETRGIKRRSFIKDYSLNFIYEIHSVISPEVYLASISFDGDDQLTIRGISATMSETLRLVDSLEDSDYFQDVKTKFATTNKIDGKDMTEFEIVCPLNKELKRQILESE
ncbi:MAG: pilus assembly protein PilM [Candidatus Omnitrophica bacterium]|nr:pilus assembly protein PilM [Candidatus Omnitrophota bacterium]